MYEQHIINDSNTLRHIEEVLLSTYFKNYDQAFLQTETGQEDIKANVFRRYNNSLAHVVPWVARQIDLRGKTLVEIGSGSSTAAFAHFVEKIDGYDIDAHGFEEEILSWVDVHFEEELLRHYFLTKKLDVPLAFSRVVLNVIYKKSERPSPELAPVPESIFVADKQLLREQNSIIRTLNERLAVTEKHLNEVLSSKRWRIGNLIAAPYRKLKALLS